MRPFIAILASTGVFAAYMKLLKKLYAANRASHVKKCAVCQRRYRLNALYCSRDASLLQFSTEAMENAGISQELFAKLPQMELMLHKNDGEQLI